MLRPAALVFALLLAAAPVLVRAQATPAPQAPLTATEASFSTAASAALQKLYPTPAAAERVGYFRYTNEDRTGAISYMNTNYFATPDPQHPSQLWYDVNGRLLGADFTQLPPASGGPTLFGIGAARFHHVPLHIHYGLYRADGTIQFGLFQRASDYQTQAGDPLHPTPEGLVKMGKATSTAQVAFVFALLENYDAQMWLIPNPAGQFADANPTVKPSPAQGGGSGESRG